MASSDSDSDYYYSDDEEETDSTEEDDDDEEEGDDEEQSSEYSLDEEDEEDDTEDDTGDDDDDEDDDIDETIEHEYEDAEEDSAIDSADDDDAVPALEHFKNDEASEGINALPSSTGSVPDDVRSPPALEAVDGNKDILLLKGNAAPDSATGQEVPQLEGPSSVSSLSSDLGKVKIDNAPSA